MKTLIIRLNKVKSYHDELLVRLYSKKWGEKASIKSLHRAFNVIELLARLKDWSKQYDLIILDSSYVVQLNGCLHPAFLRHLQENAWGDLTHKLLIRSNHPAYIRIARQQGLMAVADQESWEIADIIGQLILPAEQWFHPLGRHMRLAHGQ
jgi:hypothetical protein